MLVNMAVCNASFISAYELACSERFRDCRRRSSADESCFWRAMLQRFTRLQFLLAMSRSRFSGKLKVHSESIPTGTTINPVRCMEP